MKGASHDRIPSASAEISIQNVEAFPGRHEGRNRERSPCGAHSV